MSFCNNYQNMAYASLKCQENVFNKHFSMLRNYFIIFFTVLQLEVEHARYVECVGQAFHLSRSYKQGTSVCLHGHWEGRKLGSWLNSWDVEDYQKRKETFSTGAFLSTAFAILNKVVNLKQVLVFTWEGGINHQE